MSNSRSYYCKLYHFIFLRCSQSEILSFPGSGKSTLTAGDHEELQDPVTITVVNNKANSTFRYWIFAIQEFLFLTHSLPILVIALVGDLRTNLTILSVAIFSLNVASLVLTYFYSTDMFILVPCLVPGLCVVYGIDRLYPQQVTLFQSTATD